MEEETSKSESTPLSKEDRKRMKKEKKRGKKKRKEETKKEESSTSHRKRARSSSDLSAARPIVESSVLPFLPKNQQEEGLNVTLLLFYQYVEPPWTQEVYRGALKHVEQLGKKAGITGRMRVAKEGLNCTLTGSKEGILNFCQYLRDWKPEHFTQTEFKLTHNLPEPQRFRDLKIIPVHELVNYGLDGEKAPPIQQYHGTHLDPKDYHKKLAEENTIIIDVRNHYEAKIGRFAPPEEGENPPKWIDPKMRKSTEFPVWLDQPETLQELKGKQRTGCERASALLKYKMENDPKVKGLGIKGVYQLQGGIDRYFKEYPDGGHWKGKNYVFDKRFSHAPPEKDYVQSKKEEPIGKCEACQKPWDMYRGKRRCPTCGVPSLICKECWQADQEGRRKLDKTIRCDLCVEQNIRSKKEIREKAERDILEYEKRLQAQGLLTPSSLGGESSPKSAPNPDNVTRLQLKNMCRRNMTEDVLMDFLEGITHIVWRTDRKTGGFSGQAWVEMDSPESAGRAVARSGEKVLGRPLYISYDPPDGKDSWPPPSSTIRR